MVALNKKLMKEFSFAERNNDSRKLNWLTLYYMGSGPYRKVDFY